jgi:hypothetical protein
MNDWLRAHPYLRDSVELQREASHKASNHQRAAIGRQGSFEATPVSKEELALREAARAAAGTRPMVTVRAPGPIKRSSLRDEPSSTPSSSSSNTSNDNQSKS